MDKIAECWMWLGWKIHRRPVMILGAITGAVIWLGLMVWLFVATENTQGEIKRVRSALCGGQIAATDPADLPPQVRQNCQLLFNRIFDSATPEQIRRANETLHRGTP